MINENKVQYLQFSSENILEKNLPSSMVEREKLRDHALKKLREVLSGYTLNFSKSIMSIHIGFRFLTPHLMNDRTSITKKIQPNKFVWHNFMHYNVLSSKWTKKN